MRNYNFKTKQVILFAGLVLIFLLNILLSSLTLNLSWEDLTTSSWWLQSGLSALSSFGVFLTSFEIGLDIHYKSDEEHKENLSLIKQMGRLVDGPELDKHVEKMNWFNKRKTWVEHYSHKLSKLNKKFTTEERVKINKNEALNKKLYKKREKEIRYKEYLSDNWIDKNLMGTKFRFPILDRKELLTGSLKMQKESSYLERNIKGTSIAKKMGMLALVILANLVLLNFSIGGAINNITEFFIILFIQLLTMAFQIVMAILFASKDAHESFYVNGLDRKRILLEFQEGSSIEVRELPLEYSKLFYTNQDENSDNDLSE